MSLGTLLLFALATLLVTASPGPGVIYVLARTVGQGRRAGFASMFGIEFGEVVWLAAAATGIAALLATSTAALGFLRFGGAAYLVYLGIQRWRHVESFAAAEHAPLGRTFMQGIVTQLLNPKVAVFVIAFLPQFLDPHRAIAPQVALLAAVYIAIVLVVDTTYVMTASAIARRFAQSATARRRTGRLAAGSYFALGLAAAFTGARASA